MRWVKTSARGSGLDAGEIAKLKREGDEFISAARYNEYSVSSGMANFELVNAFENYGLIKGLFASGRAESVPSKTKKGPALIIGSGPSFDKIAPRLKDWKGGVITSTSQFTTCAALGHAPDAVVVFDALTKFKELQAVPAWDMDTRLVMHPGCHRELIEAWPLKYYFYRCLDPNSFFHSSIMPEAYNWITAYAVVFSSTMSMQVALASLMGYSPLILCGCDLGYPEGKERFTSYRWEEGEDVSYPSNFFNNDIARISNDGILTDTVGLFYKRALYCVWRLDKAKMLSCSDGILTEIPKVGVEQLMDTQGQGLESMCLSDQDVMDATDRYLAANYIYAMPINGGLRFLESRDWRNEVPLFLAKLIQMGVRGVDVDGVMSRIEKVTGEAA